MAVYIANLQIDTGVNFQHGFSLGDNDTGTYLNLNNYTVSSQMRKWAGSTSSVSFASTVTDAEQGQLQISLGSTQTTPESTCHRMTQYIKVEGHDNLVRDKQTGAILNNDSSSYQAYMRQKQVKLSERNEIEKLKSEVGEIKDMLKVIIEKL